MRVYWSHTEIDLINAQEDRRTARELRRSERLLRAARRNLARWMRRDGKRVRPVWAE